ncbi:hypothetical protein [Streptomyces microflavus]|uniref:hypothetical protein n=1 Tax=Streptomyces microflavus TaxID=1919 RepID=UPI003B22295F
MQPDAPPRNLLALAGGAGSGKTTLAEAFARARPETVLLHLDGLFHTQADRAPLVPNLNGTGRVSTSATPGPSTGAASTKSSTPRRTTNGS